jgi:hypothetical protein
MNSSFDQDSAEDEDQENDMKKDIDNLFKDDIYEINEQLKEKKFIRV